MRQSKFKLNARAFGIGLLGISLLVSFQNCGQNGFEAEELASEADVTDDSSLQYTSNIEKYGAAVAQKLEAVPVAYAVGFNQITYNSCSGKDLANKAGMFSLKFGAYGAGGLQVSQAARAYLQNTSNFRPIAPATELSVGQMKNYIYDSPTNRDLVLQMAWRTKDRPGWLRTTRPVAGKDYKDITMKLSDDRMLDPIVKNTGSWVRHFPLATEAKLRNLEGSFFYNDSEGNADFLRTDLDTGMGSDGTQGMIAFAFRKETGDPQVPLMVDENPNGSLAHGVGYTFSFIQQNAAILSNPSNILKVVSEIDLNTGGATGATWSCPDHLNFKIVRSEDAATHCPAESLNSINDVNYRKNLALVRNQLPPSQWDVNLSRRCVVPKSFQCYPNETRNGAIVPVEYNGSRECFQAHKPASHYSTANPGAVLNYCAQHVSICVRTQ